MVEKMSKDCICINCNRMYVDLTTARTVWCLFVYWMLKSEMNEVLILSCNRRHHINLSSILRLVRRMYSYQLPTCAYKVQSISRLISFSQWCRSVCNSGGRMGDEWAKEMGSKERFGSVAKGVGEALVLHWCPGQSHSRWRYYWPPTKRCSIKFRSCLSVCRQYVSR